MSNSNLHNAKKQKNDEFYTQYEDIEAEVNNYKEHFKYKVVFCNCDDPEYSNFWRYFMNKFIDFGIKRLYGTHYEKDKDSSYYIETARFEDFKGIPAFETIINGLLFEDNAWKVIFNIHKELNRDMNILVKVNNDELVVSFKHIECNGDFRSDECKLLLLKSDIICTNPPFSLFREFIAQLVQFDKKFIIMGNNNAITYKEVFPLIKNNLIWAGYGFNLSVVYKTRYKNEIEANRKYVKQHGFNPDEGYMKVSGISWFTNLSHKKRNEKLDLTKTYSPEKYPKYDNFDAINVDKVSDIPVDYAGVMGVPITFLDKYCPEQFEIIGCANANVIPAGWNGASKEFVDLYHKQGNTGQYTVGNRLSCYIDNQGKAKVPYARILIKRKDI